MNFFSPLKHSLYLTEKEIKPRYSITFKSLTFYFLAPNKNNMLLSLFNTHVIVWHRDNIKALNLKKKKKKKIEKLKG